MSQSAENRMLQWALWYAKRGWPVLALHTPKKGGGCSCSQGSLCHSAGKHPHHHPQLLKHGAKSATTDPELIKKWWEMWPDANIGIATGKDSFDVLDVDLKGNGPDTLSDLEGANETIPDTIEQITGSGGRQIMFQHCGGLVGNEVKFASGLDTRSTGGLVVVPPSLHSSGNRYEWEASSNPADGKQLQPMPQWLLGEILKNRKKYGGNGTGKPVEVSRVMNGLQKGERDQEIFRYACRLRSLGLSREEAEPIILSVAAKCDPPFPEKDALRKLTQAWKYELPEPTDADYPGKAPQDTNNTSDTTDTVNTDAINRYKLIQTSSKLIQTDTNSNYYGIFSTWLETCDGHFKMQEAAEELGWKKDARHYANFRNVLSRAVKNGLIGKVGAIRGIYRVIKKDYDEIDIENTEIKEFPLLLPLGLHKLVEIEPKEIILIAGETNAGKTCFIYNTLWMNIFNLEALGLLKPKKDDDPDKIALRYFSSEMGAASVKKKLLAFGPSYPIPKFINHVVSISRNSGFQDAIDPTGINCIDYLEAPEGEYYKIAPTISEIFARLSTGVCLVAIQKRTGVEFGRGGEATLEKPRLAISLTYNKEKNYHTARITKGKNTRSGDAIYGLELDFLIEHGVKMIEVSGWDYADRHEKRRKTVDFRRERHDEYKGEW